MDATGTYIVRIEEILGYEKLSLKKINREKGLAGGGRNLILAIEKWHDQYRGTAKLQIIRATHPLL